MPLQVDFVMHVFQGSAFVYIFANDMRTLSENENERVREHVFVFVYAILFGLGQPSGVPPQKKRLFGIMEGMLGAAEGDIS